MTRAAPRLLGLLVGALVLAGCTSNPSQSTTTPTPTVTTPDATSAPHVTATSSGFAIDGPKITPLDGSDRGLFEDDGAKVTFTVTQPGSASGPASFFVTFLYNGEIVDTQTVQLGPGQSKAFERSFANLTGVKEAKAEVRAGSSNAKASVIVKNWPRLGTPTSVEGLGIDVARAGVDPADNSVVVNVTLTRAGGSPQTLQDLKAKLMCADASGNLTLQGSQPLPVPAPGEQFSSDLRFPACSAPKALAIAGTVVATGKPALLHVIFPAGSVGTYTPPPPPAALPS